MPYEIDFSPDALEYLGDHDELDIEAWQLGENPDFLALIERSRTRYRQEGGIPLHEVRRWLGLAG